LALAGATSATSSAVAWLNSSGVMAHILSEEVL
jgi:hypothetical protein